MKDFLFLLMTISVRLSKEIEDSLREEAKRERKNISDIVNTALEKYHNEYKYFDSINAHHLDPIIINEFMKLADTPEKIQRIADAGVIMTNKFIAYQNHLSKSLDDHIELLKKFFKLHSVTLSISKNSNTTNLVGVHEFGTVFSDILSRGIKKTLIKFTENIETVIDEGSFTLKIKE